MAHSDHIDEHEGKGSAFTKTRLPNLFNFNSINCMNLSMPEKIRDSIESIGKGEGLMILHRSQFF